MIDEDVARSMVEQAGGIYVGVQSAEPVDLILFNDPKTETTISVKVNIASVKMIRAKMLLRRIQFTQLHGSVTGSISHETKTNIALHLEVEEIRKMVAELAKHISGLKGLAELMDVIDRLNVLNAYLKSHEN